MKMLCFSDPGEIPEIVRLLCKKGARPITLSIETPVKLLKKHRISGQACPFDGINKVSRINGIINFDYESSVNRQLGREGKIENFNAQNNWFFHDINDPRPIVTNKSDNTKKYLQIKL